MGEDFERKPTDNSTRRREQKFEKTFCGTDLFDANVVKPDVCHTVLAYVQEGHTVTVGMEIWSNETDCAQPRLFYQLSPVLSLLGECAQVVQGSPKGIVGEVIEANPFEPFVTVRIRPVDGVRHDPSFESTGSKSAS